ncbi:MAG TPA: hypothetical protein VLV49_13375 [Terriglobales bacterium]|nr:hypothetical protein [Terriglobales bacterium]
MPRSANRKIQKIHTLSSGREAEFRKRFYAHFENCPIPAEELFNNLGLFLSRQSLSRLLYMHELYQKVVNVHGVVAEFGTRWGQNLALFSSFRGIYEPYNHTRKIIGFDTFSGFTGVSRRDKRSPSVMTGAYGVSPGYERYLEGILDYHEQESPLSHIKKYALVKGDVAVTVPRYLKDHPETIIALAYFDMDLYEPTRKCLGAIRDYLTRGSILAFDELCHPAFPGETAAVREVLGTRHCRIERSPLAPTCAYVIVE